MLLLKEAKSRDEEYDDHDDERQRNNCFDKIIYFFNAPVVKFSYQLILFCLFLLLLSYTLISKFMVDHIEWNEIALAMFQFGFILHELRQVKYSCSFSFSDYKYIQKHTLQSLA